MPSAPTSPCSALNNAIQAKGVSIPQIAQNVGSTPERVSDIVSGKQRPTQQEFDRLAQSLDIKSAAPHDSAHTTST